MNFLRRLFSKNLRTPASANLARPKVVTIRVQTNAQRPLALPADVLSVEQAREWLLGHDCAPTRPHLSHIRPTADGYRLADLQAYFEELEDRRRESRVGPFRETRPELG